MPLLACVVRTDPNDTVRNAENGDAWFLPVLVSSPFWALCRDPVIVMPQLYLANETNGDARSPLLSLGGNTRQNFDWVVGM